MSREVSVAVLQLAAHDRAAFTQRWPQICTRIREAASQGAQLVVLPEGTVPAYVLGHEPIESELLQAALDDVQSLARSTESVIVYGTARHSADGLYNSAYVIDADGSFAGSADKRFLWDFDHDWFVAGRRGAPIQTAVGILGVLICADGRIPTIARALVDGGAEMLVMPTAWVTSGRDPHHLENAQADLLAAVRARENAVPFAAANKVGVERECVAYCGKSVIITSDGTVVARASQRSEETLIASVGFRRTHPPRITPSEPARAQAPAQELRLAITPHDVDADTIHAILGVDELVTSRTRPGDRALARAAAACVDDDAVGDPGGLVPYRLAGYQLLIWRSDWNDEAWMKTLARARALELRVFMIVIRDGAFAFAVDPDGVIACGTFGGFRVASFTFSPARTMQTAVAPKTDILEGLDRASVMEV